MKKTFYSNGKLLLTGEYAVLDGALSLAVPTRYGQSLEVVSTAAREIEWTSLDHENSIWFEGVFNLDHLTTSRSKEKQDTGNTVAKILSTAMTLNPEFLKSSGGLVTSKTDFPLDWGLGSSSTLVNNIATWANVDPYRLLFMTFGGSGYDIACANSNNPLLYCLEGGAPKITKTVFDPSFREQLYFVYLNRKQNSREGITKYRRLHFDQMLLVDQISEITVKIVDCNGLEEFIELLTFHESLLSEILHLPTVKASLFRDYLGGVKSLGAWGGDFILVTGDEESPDYFKRKGYKTIIPYSEMVLYT